MKVSLSLLIENWETKNTPDLLSFLFENKRKGYLFFYEDVYKNQGTAPFHLYFFLFPNKSSEINAFPVPSDFYKELNAKRKNKIKILCAFFNNYYKTPISQADLFSNYDVEHPYIGSEYTWFLKKKKIDRWYNYN